MILTGAERDELRLLSLMTEETKKLAIAVNYVMTEDQQTALERLMLRDWIRLIDVGYVANMPGIFMRIFRVMPDAVTWYELSRRAP